MNIERMLELRNNGPRQKSLITANTIRRLVDEEFYNGGIRLMLLTRQSTVSPKVGQ